MTFFWVVAIIGALWGGVELFFVFASAASAPQQAAGAAMAAALAIVPYTLARSIYLVSGSEEVRRQTALLADIARLIRNPAETGLPEAAPLHPANKSHGVMIGIGVAFLLVVMMLISGLPAGFIGGARQESVDAKKACLEFKEVFVELKEPTSRMAATAVDCRAKGYW